MSTYQGKTAEEWARMLFQLDAQCQDYLQQIYAKKQRDKREQATQFRVVTITTALPHDPDSPGQITIDVHRDELGDYATAERIATFYDNAIVQTRTITAWKNVNAAADLTLTGT